MISDGKIRNLTAAQRDVLFRHIDEAVDVVVSDRFDRPTFRSLINAGLLRGHPTGSPRPRHTVLTEEGKRAVCLILGDYADALYRAGFFELADRGSPFEVIERLRKRAGGSRTPAA